MEEMKMSDYKNKLLREIQKLSNELGEIELREKLDRNQSLVGKYFKSTNCYSCPETSEDYWQIYHKITRMDENGDLRMWSFEKTIDNHINIRLDEYYWDRSRQEIDAVEFYVAWQKLTTEISKIN